MLLCDPNELSHYSLCLNLSQNIWTKYEILNDDNSGFDGNEWIMVKCVLWLSK